jgi:predicted ABC-type ATPase
LVNGKPRFRSVRKLLDPHALNEQNGSLTKLQRKSFLGHIVSKRRPTIHLIAGPNGAGKTTFAREFLPEADVVEFLNADLLAAGLSPLDPRRMALRSGRLLLERWKELVDMRCDFAFESTLSGRTYLHMLQNAKQEGYRVHLCYLWLPSVSLCLRRIKQRVRKGGHDVPPSDVRRRFGSSLRNVFAHYLPLADRVALFDASSSPPRTIARWSKNGFECIVPEVYEEVLRQAQNA